MWGMMRLNVEELMMVPSDMIGLHTSTSLPHSHTPTYLSSEITMRLRLRRGSVVPIEFDFAFVIIWLFVWLLFV